MMAPLDQPLLWEEAQRAMRDRLKTIAVDLGGERPVTVKVTGIEDGGSKVGAVIELMPTGPPRRRGRRGLGRTAGVWRPTPSGSTASSSAPSAAANCGGMQSSTRCWRWANASRVALLGESGVGKERTLAGALAAAFETGPPIEYDARAAFADEPGWTATLAAGLEAAGNRTVLVRHLEQLSSRALASVCYAVDATEAGRVVATWTFESEGEPYDNRLLGTFGEPVELPPLRCRPEDLAELATQILADVAQPATARLEPASIRALGRSDWPGNVAQLRRAIEAAYAEAPGSVIREVDLPGAASVPASRTSPASSGWSGKRSLPCCRRAAATSASPPPTWASRARRSTGA